MYLYVQGFWLLNTFRLKNSISIRLATLYTCQYTETFSEAFPGSEMPKKHQQKYYYRIQEADSQQNSQSLPIYMVHLQNHLRYYRSESVKNRLLRGLPNSYHPDKSHLQCFSQLFS
jgi:hypothetical protein